MQIYRLYLLNPRTGGIDGFEEISAADDSGAAALVDRLAHNVPTELWVGSRKVGRYDPPVRKPAGEPIACPA
jgi:hypothetical protein